MPVDALTILDSRNDPYIPPPTGYYRIPVDLNKGAGGDYIYLAYRVGSGKPITGLYVSSQGSGGAQPPLGYASVQPETDLNKGSGGRYLYLCYSDDPSIGDPIANLNVLTGPNANPPVPDGWSILLTDLNEGAGGDYIYVIYAR